MGWERGAQLPQAGQPLALIHILASPQGTTSRARPVLACFEGQTGVKLKGSQQVSAGTSLSTHRCSGPGLRLEKPRPPQISATGTLPELPLILP